MSLMKHKKHTLDEQAAASVVAGLCASIKRRRVSSEEEQEEEAAAAAKRAKVSPSNDGEAKSEPVEEWVLKPAPYFYYTDRSREPDDDPLTPLTVPGRVPNFPAKMHSILNDPTLSDVVGWVSHGRAWRILKPREFEIRVIPKYFEHSKFSSFIRQANGWGFRRMSQGHDRNAYYHEYFLRGLPYLCKLMRRPKVAEKKSVDPEHEPDLYAISRERPLPLKAGQHGSIGSHGLHALNALNGSHGEQFQMAHIHHAPHAPHAPSAVLSAVPSHVLPLTLESAALSSASNTSTINQMVLPNHPSTSHIYSSSLDPHHFLTNLSTAAAPTAPTAPTFSNTNSPFHLPLNTHASPTLLDLQAGSVLAAMSCNPHFAAGFMAASSAHAESFRQAAALYNTNTSTVATTPNANTTINIANSLTNSRTNSPTDSSTSITTPTHNASTLMYSSPQENTSITTITK